MIQRFYVHNYRCLDNFVLPIGGLSSALLIGANGAGKSNVGFALEILQKIGRGNNRVGSLLWPRDISHGKKEEPVRLEITVELKGVRFEYVLAFELPTGFQELRVLDERLMVDGQVKFSRKVAEVQLPKADGSPGGSTGFDWHLVWLPVMQSRSENDPVHVFREWLARMIILRPYPLHIDGNSTTETLYPNTEVTNLGDWWTGITRRVPRAYGVIDEILRRVMPDLKDIQNPPVAKEAHSLVVQFDGEPSPPPPVPFELLSDGEKCMVIWALTMAANEAYGPVFCFWDEPDNYLAISEVGNFTTDLRKAFQAGGQFVATSHNSESIRRFSDENTFILYRRSHAEPTQIRPLAEIEYAGDLIGALTRGEIEP